MKIEFLDEPELEFGADKHVDIRFGLRNYGPLDFQEPDSPKQINVGIVGTREDIEGVEAWLDKCRSGIPAKESAQPNLFSDFPGFTRSGNLKCTLYTSASLQRDISPREFMRLKNAKSVSLTVEQGVKLFLAEIEGLASKNKNIHVIICAPPTTLLQAMNSEETKATDPATGKMTEQTKTDLPDFHDLLKARAMAFGIPIQVILPSTYDESKRPLQKRRRALRTSQDEATRAWNVHVALYYKAGGVPWRLIRRPEQYAACYVGVSFFQARDKSQLLTSVAQVFNERGEGMAVRGSAAFIDKDDLQIHLTAQNAFLLLDKALRTYEGEHHHMPARVVLHKSSRFSEDEKRGFRQALEANHARSLDLVSIYDSELRLFRLGAYPPLRGTFLRLSDRSSILYTRGSVEFFETYPGMYVPQSLGLRFEDIESAPLSLAAEILALTKMNWNNTQFDGYEPITLAASRKVGRILKYLDHEDEKNIKSRYSFYM